MPDHLLVHAGVAAWGPSEEQHRGTQDMEQARKAALALELRQNAPHAQRDAQELSRIAPRGIVPRPQEAQHSVDQLLRHRARQRTLHRRINSEHNIELNG